MDNLIIVSFINNQGHIFNAKDYIKLRKEHHIVGHLVGCNVLYPRNPNLPGLPAVLSIFELQLLADKKIIRIENKVHLESEPTAQDKETYTNFIESNKQEQFELLRTKKVEESRKVVDKVVEGKRKRLEQAGKDPAQVTEDSVLADIYNNCTFNPDNIIVEVPTEHYKTRADSVEVVLSPNHTLQYLVFKDLWERGKYITNGHTFGGDFLVYPGDPLYFHASHIVHCIECANGEISPVELVANGRLSVGVNKLCVFAYFNENHEIAYQTMEWEGNKIDEIKPQTIELTE